jgi:hypothetical protein
MPVLWRLLRHQRQRPRSLDELKQPQGAKRAATDGGATHTRWASPCTGSSIPFAGAYLAASETRPTPSEAASDAGAWMFGATSRIPAGLTCHQGRGRVAAPVDGVGSHTQASADS